MQCNDVAVIDKIDIAIMLTYLSCCLSCPIDSMACGTFCALCDSDNHSCHYERNFKHIGNYLKFLYHYNP